MRSVLPSFPTKRALLWLGCLVAGVAMLFGGRLSLCAAEPGANQWPAQTLTNFAEVRRWASRQQGLGCAVSLEGVVVWSSRAREQLILGDASGALQVKLEPRNQPPVQPGQKVRLEGQGVAGFGILSETLVDNDGFHGPLERSGAIYLSAGRHPVCAEWFNGPAKFSLDIEYEGPGVPRQPIPAAALFRPLSNALAGTAPLGPGLNYSCYEGIWESLPDFARLRPVKSGSCANFDLSARTRDQNVGLRFTGFLEVPRSGLYTFYTKSDDGSRLFVARSGLHLTVLGAGELPVPQTITPGQVLRDEQAGHWAEVEGTVTFSHVEPAEGLELELHAGTNRMYLSVLEPAGVSPDPFSRVRARGLCLSAEWAEGRLTAERLVVPSGAHLQILEAAPNPQTLVATNLAQLRQLVAAGPRRDYQVHLQGLVLAASPSRGILAFQDASGAALVEIPLLEQAPAPGQQITLQGRATVEARRLILRTPVLVDNDGIHSFVEKSGTLFLNAGKHPFRLCWFNRDAPSGLTVAYQGPDLPYQRIPDAAFFRRVVHPATGAVTWTNGLDYRAYAGAWIRMPTFGELQPIKTGSAPNLDLALAGRTEEVGLEFSGYVEVPRPGLYTFFTRSDDGSLLFVEEQPPQITLAGTNALPLPQRIAGRQLLSERQKDQWSEVEGTVTFASGQPGVLALELNCGTGSLQVEVADPTGLSLPLLLNSRIRAVGVCQSAYLPDGREAPGALLVPGSQQIQILDLAPTQWESWPLTSIGTLAGWHGSEGQPQLVHLQGKACASGGGQLMLEDPTGRTLVELMQPTTVAEGSSVEVLGTKGLRGTNWFVQCGFVRLQTGSSTDSTRGQAPLTTIEQVKALSREQAQRGYPVRIRGVVTAPRIGGFFIQDSTWAIYVQWQPSGSADFPCAGDYWEVEGATYAEFAPNISARRAVRLGPGRFPEPLRPAWDQLINGSLDTLYIELQGVVTDIRTNQIHLLTRDGKVNVELLDVPMQTLARYENALIRLRGCLLPGRDLNTLQVDLGQVALANVTINLDAPAPTDPFALPLKRGGDLLRFDPQAGALQRVKITGQVLRERQGTFYLADGEAGLRFVPKNPTLLAPGDQVEVVGFPELGGPSPLLHEAVVRRIGHAELPAAKPLSEEGLLEGHQDAMLVKVQARLAGLSRYRSEQVLELQTKARGFVARLDTRHGLPRNLLPGSRLELTGVYSGLAADRLSPQGLASFELLLNSPADIRVLEQPSWWSLQHTLAVLGGMASVVLGALLWITVLRRQVEERTRQLGTEMQRREHSEHQRALEEDRARIARDLHDDLGANLTRIGLLGELVRSDESRAEMDHHAGQIAATVRETVGALDEIVWAVNPRSDSLDSLLQYLSHYADKFFEETDIQCHLDFPIELPTQPLTVEVKHSLFLVVKEALNNILRHSAATEVRLRAQVATGALQLDISDNGRGFALPQALPRGKRSGLGNMRHRLETLGGTLTVDSHPGQGTQVRLRLPLSSADSSPLGPAI